MLLSPQDGRSFSYFSAIDYIYKSERQYSVDERRRHIMAGTNIGTHQKITPFLWFEDNAEEAVNFYTSIFKNSRINNITRYGDAGPGPKGSVMTVEFQLEGQAFVALNGGPEYKFTPAISFFVDCETQQEVDELWEKLTAGGEELACGWLTDRYSVSWQITPRVLIEMLQDKNPEKARRVTEAMLQMKKIDIRTLQEAYAQR
jgi:predicted 3-demethylubiquinone-9 3-methyltransferase (glyoxalase superfamily)